MAGTCDSITEGGALMQQVEGTRVEIFRTLKNKLYQSASKYDPSLKV